MSEQEKTGICKLIENAKNLGSTLAGSYLRNGKPDSDKSRASITFNNFFLHIQGVKTHLNTLRPGYTWGMGLISLFLLVFTIVSGVLLTIYYSPSIESAYNTVKDIKYVVFAGNLTRNIHKWAGEGMIIFVILHMARVLYTSSYKQGREFNWVIGIILLAITFFINFTGYLLPWDQLSYWALVIGANIAKSPNEITDFLGLTQYFDMGSLQKEMLLGGTIPGEATIPRVYFLHIMLLPLIMFIILGVHFWRIRKDGGLTRPDEFEPKGEEAELPAKKGGIFPTNKTYGLMELAKGRTPAVDRDVENTVFSWPNLLRAEIAVFLLTFAGILIYSMYIDAPLKELANPLIPENPAKAPWYFLGLQEMVSYSAFMGGIGLPTLALIGLGLIPYLDREPQYMGIWFSNRQGKVVAAQSFVVGVVVLVSMLAVTVSYGWFRNWWPDVPQLLITLVNPGTIWVGFMMAYALWTTKKTNSTRMGAIALFTMFLLSYVILTYVGTELRGPNWEFFWSHDQWPIH